MAAKSNRMSLDSDLRFPPKGPVKWGWLEKMFTRIARQARIISPSKTVQIKVSTSGQSLHIETQDENLPEPPFSLSIEKRVNGWNVAGCNVGILGNNYVIEDALIQSLGIVAIQIDLALISGTGTGLTCRFHEALDDTQCEVIGTPIFSTVTLQDITNALTVRPGHRNTGVIYIPIANLELDYYDHYWATPDALPFVNGFEVSLYHDSYGIAVTL